MISSIRKKRKRTKELIIILCVYACIFLVFIVGIMITMFISVGKDSPKNAINSGDFPEALSDSIKIYGVDFTSAIAVYLLEHGTFESYSREKFRHTQEEIREVIENESEARKTKKLYDLYFSGIVKKNEIGVYYNWYFPIPKEYEVSYIKDWGNFKSDGDLNAGIDLMCNEGVPIISIESGVINEIGWNETNGWRIEILGENETRIWIYGNMRKVHPYVKTLRKGSKINAGQVIGYVGSTGNSNDLKEGTMPENERAVDDFYNKHLHIVVLTGDTGFKIAYNPFSIIDILKINKISVVKEGEEFVTKEKSIFDRLVNNVVMNDGELGSLSAKHESNGNPGIIVNNKGDPGGKSYGAFQFATKRGSLDSFLFWLFDKDKNLYNRLINAKNKDHGYKANFDTEWRKIAKEDRDYFYSLQQGYIKYAYFDPIVRHFNSKGFEIEKRSKTLQSVIWSTSVQHGVGGARNIISMQNLKGTDKEIISGIYFERMKVNVHFSGSSQSIKNSVYRRFVAELQEALIMLEGEGR